MALTNELYRVLAGAGFDIRDIRPLSCGDEMCIRDRDIDIHRVYEEAEGAFTVFGNLNSVDTLLHGSTDDVINETTREIELCNHGKFIMSNDCPICFDTPVENIQAMIETARGYR